MNYESTDSLPGREWNCACRFWTEPLQPSSHSLPLGIEYYGVLRGRLSPAGDTPFLRGIEKVRVVVDSGEAGDPPRSLARCLLLPKTGTRPMDCCNVALEFFTIMSAQNSIKWESLSCCVFIKSSCLRDREKL